MKKTTLFLISFCLFTGCGPTNQKQISTETEARSYKGIPVRVGLQDETPLPVDVRIRKDEAIAVELQMQGKQTIPVKVQWQGNNSKPIKVDMQPDKPLPVEVNMPGNTEFSVKMSDSWVALAAAFGAFAGLFIWICSRLNEFYLKCRDGRRIYRWLDKVTAPDDAKKWRQTRAIASYTNLTEDRVRFICFGHKKIVRSSKEAEVWSISGRARQENQTGVVYKHND